MAQRYEDSIEKVMITLREVSEDAVVPRNIKLKLQSIISHLNKNTELSIKLNKALNELDDIVNDVNLQPHTRTQIYSVVSILEKMTQSIEYNE